MVAFSAPVERVPLRDRPPDQPPDAVQFVALVALQLSVDAAPLVTVLGLADSVTVGAGRLTETVADWDALVPPVPVQLSV